MNVFGYFCDVPGGTSRPAAVARLRTECDRRFPSIRLDFFADGYSSRCVGFASRIAGSELHSRLERGSVVVFAELYGAFRRHSDLVRMLTLWKDMGVRVIALDVDLANPEEVESWRLSLHRRRSLEAKAIGRVFKQPLAQAPLGFRLVGRRGQRKLVPDHREMSMMAEAHRLWLNGHGRHAIARSLMLAGERSPRTRREWSPSTVWRAVHEYAARTVL